MLAASVLSHGVALAKDPPAAAPPAEGARSGKETDPLVQLVRSLTPEQKTRLIESIKTWQELTPEVKQALRAREKNLKKTLLEEMEAALAGTNFTQEQKDLFEKRFKEERRKLEVALRTEIEARRKAGVQEISEKVKAEVSATAPTATPPNAPEKPAQQEK
jgi:capsule polysaccharide export protein KpsE/RkpR